MDYKDIRKGQKVKVRRHQVTATTWVGTTPREREVTVPEHVGTVDEIYSQKRDAGSVVVYSDKHGYVEVMPENLDPA